jgi:hypothetical protein
VSGKFSAGVPVTWEFFFTGFLLIMMAGNNIQLRHGKPFQCRQQHARPLHGWKTHKLLISLAEKVVINTSVAVVNNPVDTATTRQFIRPSCSRAAEAKGTSGRSVFVAAEVFLPKEEKDPGRLSTATVWKTFQR